MILFEEKLFPSGLNKEKFISQYKKKKKINGNSMLSNSFFH